MEIKENKISFIWIVLLIVIIGVVVVYINEGIFPKVSDVESSLQKVSAKITKGVDTVSAKSKDIIEEGKKEIDNIVKTDKDNTLESSTESNENVNSESTNAGEESEVFNLSNCVIYVETEGINAEDLNFLNTGFKDAFIMESSCKLIFENIEKPTLKITNDAGTLQVVAKNTMIESCRPCKEAFVKYFIRDDVSMVLKDKFGWTVAK